MKKERESGFKLLRILIMLEIIFLHVCGYGHYLDIIAYRFYNHYLLAYLVWFLCRCPVYVFMIYFLVNAEMTKEKIVGRIKKIYAPMLFFSITITIVGYYLRLWEFKDININKMFFPFASCTWYF